MGLALFRDASHALRIGGVKNDVRNVSTRTTFRRRPLLASVSAYLGAEAECVRLRMVMHDLPLRAACGCVDGITAVSYSVELSGARGKTVRPYFLLL